MYKKCTSQQRSLKPSKQSSYLGGLAALYDGLGLGVNRRELPFPLEQVAADHPDILLQLIHFLPLRAQLHGQLLLLGGKTVALLPGAGDRDPSRATPRTSPPSHPAAPASRPRDCRPLTCVRLRELLLQ